MYFIVSPFIMFETYKQSLKIFKENLVFGYYHYIWCETAIQKNVYYILSCINLMFSNY